MRIWEQKSDLQVVLPMQNRLNNSYADILWSGELYVKVTMLSTNLWPHCLSPCITRLQYFQRVSCVTKAV